jgi:hypothetical protein
MPWLLHQVDEWEVVLEDQIVLLHRRRRRIDPIHHQLEVILVPTVMADIILGQI